jgi:hypothetical protein
MGDKIYDYIKLNSRNAGEAGNMAMGLWLAGKAELALYVLGKVCGLDAANADNISNYSAMLSMLGLQHLAIPILNNLNAKYPKNSTLLNNLGQAWFGLGDMGKAEKYLDSAIRIYTYHPQANGTKSLIEESKGNKQGAVEAAKRSIAKAYTLDKEQRLKKLGYKPTNKDLDWDRPMPQDPLGLEKFVWPEYPANVEESKALEPAWLEFRKKCRDALDELRALQPILEKEAEEANTARMKLLIQAGQRGATVQPMPPLAYKAMARLGYLVDDKDGHLSFSYQKKAQTISDANIEVAKLNDKLDLQLRAIEEKYEDQFGEGKPNPFDEACADDTKAKNSFLGPANALLRDAQNDFLAFMRRKINNEMYYYQYTMPPESFEVAKLQAKIGWLTMLESQNPRFQHESPWCGEKTDKKEKPFQLAKFDDIACQYNDTMELYVITFYNNCSRMTSKLNVKFLEYTRYDDFERAEGDTYMGSTVKISAEKGFDKLKWEKGPLKLEAKLGASIEFEMDRTGIKDVTVSVEAKMGAGHNLFDEPLEKTGSIAGKDVLDTTLEVGVEGRMSLVSGHGRLSASGKLEKLQGSVISKW